MLAGVRVEEGRAARPSWCPDRTAQERDQQCRGGYSLAASRECWSVAI